MQDHGVPQAQVEKGGSMGTHGSIRRRSIAVAILAVVSVVLGTAAVAHTGHHATDTDVQPTRWFADGTDAGGTAYVTRMADRVLLTIDAANLVPGNAYTIWWVVFNEPSGCSDGHCGEDDVFGPDGLNVAGIQSAGVAVGNATGGLAQPDGRAEFGAVLTDDQTNDGHQILIPAGLDQSNGLLTGAPADVEVHLIVQDHGQRRGGKALTGQISYVETFCTPTCADVQFAISLP